MKHRYLLFLSILCSWLCTSCEFETSANGDLDGYWQLKTVVYNGAGNLNVPGVEPTDGSQTEDMVGKRLFWSFQVNLLQLSDQRFILPTYLFRFEHQGDSLFIRDPYEVDRAAADRPVTDASVLAPYRLYGLEQRFCIERQDDEAMWLKGDSLEYFFRKF